MPYLIASSFLYSFWDTECFKPVSLTQMQHTLTFMSLTFELYQWIVPHSNGLWINLQSLSCSRNQNPYIRYLIYWSLLLWTILCQLHSILTPTPLFFKTHLNRGIQSTIVSPKRNVPFISSTAVTGICLSLVRVFWVVLVLQAEACKTSTTQNQPHQNSNTQRTENKTTDVVIQQHSRKLLMMDILTSETCWEHKKWNKIASDIKLVFHSSTITMMHGPINIRLISPLFDKMCIVLYDLWKQNFELLKYSEWQSDCSLLTCVAVWPVTNIRTLNKPLSFLQEILKTKVVMYPNVSLFLLPYISSRPRRQ